jgi:hypothetical protein
VVPRGISPCGGDVARHHQRSPLRRPSPAISRRGPGSTCPSAALAGSTVIGALTGTLVGQRVPQRALGRAFAVVVASVAMFLLVDVLVLGGPPGS